MPAGVRHVLRKPVLLDSLLVTIEGACGGPASAVHLCARYELGESGDLPARRAAS